MTKTRAKVLFHFDAGEKLQALTTRYSKQGLNIVCCPEGPDQPFISELADADVLWHVLHPITAELIDRAPRLKLIQKIGVGVNTIDLEAAKARHIAVCNMPGTNSRAVAEMTLLLMLSALRKLPRLDKICRSGQWAVDETTKETLGEIGKRTVGFVGFGAVPEILAPILEAMGVTVIYTTRSRKDVPYEFLPLEDLLAAADIVTLHVPLDSDTEQLLNASKLGLMKPDAVLINTARGGLVDENALYDALVSGQLGAAGLDVFSEEPATADNPLLTLDNVAVTPHSAWLTNETFSRSIEIAVANSHLAVSGGELKHRVV